MCILCSSEQEHGLHLGPDTFATSQHLAWRERLLCLGVLLVLFGQLPAAADHLHNVTASWITSRVRAALS